MNAITTVATISHVDNDELGCCDFEIGGKELGEVLDVGVDDVIGEGGGDWVKDGWEVGIGVIGLGACGFGAVRKGV